MEACAVLTVTESHILHNTHAWPHLLETPAEKLKDPLHIAPLLHGDHTSVVFLVDPHQEGFLIVVPGIDRHLIIILCRNIEANIFGL